MATDIIFIDRLGLSANIGLDCWGRRRPQPIFISIYLHLTPNGFLSRSGQSDNVNDSVDYGSLTKAVMRYVESEKNGFNAVEQLIDGVADQAFGLAGENGKEVRVILELPKLVPLAEGGIAVEVTRRATQGTQDSGAAQKKVYVKDLSYAVIIGVNEPERRDKQRVLVNLEVYERENVTIDYLNVVRSLSKDVECMEYFTLEKMVWEIARAVCFTLGKRIEKITVRAQKPSALSFARSSGVEMTRRMSDFEDNRW